MVVPLSIVRGKQKYLLCTHQRPITCSVTLALLSHPLICTAGKNWSLALSPITGMFAPGLKRGDGKPFDRTGWEHHFFVDHPVSLTPLVSKEGRL